MALELCCSPQQKRLVFYSVMVCDRSHLPVPKKRLRNALYIPPQFGDLSTFGALSTLEKKRREAANSCVPCDGGKCRASNTPAVFARFVMRACAEEIMWPWLSLFVIRSMQDNDEETPEWGISVLGKRPFPNSP